MIDFLEEIDRILREEEINHRKRIARLMAERQRFIDLLTEQKSLQQPPPMVIKAQ